MNGEISRENGETYSSGTTYVLKMPLHPSGGSDLVGFKCIPFPCETVNKGAGILPVSSLC